MPSANDENGVLIEALGICLDVAGNDDGLVDDCVLC